MRFVLEHYLFPCDKPIISNVSHNGRTHEANLKHVFLTSIMPVLFMIQESHAEEYNLSLTTGYTIMGHHKATSTSFFTNHYEQAAMASIHKQ